MAEQTVDKSTEKHPLQPWADQSWKDFIASVKKHDEKSLGQIDSNTLDCMEKFFKLGWLWCASGMTREVKEMAEAVRESEPKAP